MTSRLKDFIRERRIIDDLMNPEKRLIMVVGGSDTGKTTLVESLAELFSRHTPTGIVDLHMGQSHIGPPTTVAWGKVEGGFDDWSKIAAEDFYFTGSVSPLGNLLPAVVGAKLLVDRALSSCGKVIVDTTGLIAEPAGRVLKHFKLDMLSPDIVLALERGRELTHILDPFRFFVHPRIHRIPAPTQVATKSTPRRSKYRFEKIRSYFQYTSIREVSLDRAGSRFAGAPWRSGMTGLRNRVVSFMDVLN